MTPAMTLYAYDGRHSRTQHRGQRRYVTCAPPGSTLSTMGGVSGEQNGKMNVLALVSSGVLCASYYLSTYFQPKR